MEQREKCINEADMKVKTVKKKRGRKSMREKALLSASQSPVMDVNYTKTRRSTLLLSGITSRNGLGNPLDSQSSPSSSPKNEVPFLVAPKGKTRIGKGVPKIKVGENHQAKVQPISDCYIEKRNQALMKASEFENVRLNLGKIGSQLLWEAKKANESDLNSYLSELDSICTAAYGFPMNTGATERVLHILHDKNYNYKNAIDSIRIEDLAPRFPGEERMWSENETSLFNEGYLCYGTNFLGIQQEFLSSRSTREITNYYFQRYQVDPVQVNPLLLGTQNSQPGNMNQTGGVTGDGFENNGARGDGDPQNTDRGYVNAHSGVGKITGGVGAAGVVSGTAGVAESTGTSPFGQHSFDYYGQSGLHASKYIGREELISILQLAAKFPLDGFCIDQRLAVALYKLRDKRAGNLRVVPSRSPVRSPSPAPDEKYPKKSK